MADNDLIRKSDVLKIIEDIKCDDSIPKNYGTLLDIMKQIRGLPDVRQKELEEQEWKGCLFRYKNKLRMLHIIKNEPYIPLWKISSDLKDWSINVPHIVSMLEEDGIVNCNIQDGKKYCRLTEKGSRLVDEIEEYYEL